MDAGETDEQSETHIGFDKDTVERPHPDTGSEVSHAFKRLLETYAILKFHSRFEVLTIETMGAGCSFNLRLTHSQVQTSDSASLPDSAH